MRETVFGGSCVRQDGIHPNIAKLEAVAKWPMPHNLLDLMRFLGLMGYFRSFIQDYVHIAAPLTDLQCNLDIPQPEQCKGKWKHRQFLYDSNLEEPVLQAPKFDGTPFILITDVSKDGFGAVLAQCFTTDLPNGETETEIHPIGYASKHTAPAGEHYKPYVLEFTTLKFGLDHFSNTIWGFL